MTYVYYYLYPIERRIPEKEAIDIMNGVSKFWNLGIQLGVPSDKLNEIEQYLPEEQKAKIVMAWIKRENNPTYKKLYHALKQRSVDDKRAAERVARMCKALSLCSSVSVDCICPDSTSEGKHFNGHHDIDQFQ